MALLRAGCVFLALAILVGVVGTARADTCTMPDGGWPDAGVILADGGVIDVPVQLACGQPAPFAGWELTEASAERAALAPPPAPVVLELPDAGSGSSSLVGPCIAGGAAAGVVIFLLGALVGHALH